MLRSSLHTTFLLVLIMKAHATLPVHILTHNIRYAANPPSTGEEPWSVRKRLISNELRYSTIANPESFICLQEVLNVQLVDIMSALNNEAQEWAYIGVGRDDGKEKGEYSPILYRTSVWELEHWKTVWLNEDGAVGKKGWDAGSVRIVTVGDFKHRQSKKRIVGLCTHFDNAGSISRRESAKIVLKLVESTISAIPSDRHADKAPFFLAGDLNSEPSQEAYQILNDERSLMRDAKELAKWTYGNKYTFTDFDDGGLSVIDFVFLGPRGEEDWGVEGYSVLSNRFDDGVYGSDHRAVVVDAVLKL